MGYTPTPGSPRSPCLGGTGFGGSNAINGQVFFRGVPEDYDEWSYVNVLPSFRMSETDLDFHGFVF